MATDGGFQPSSTLGSRREPGERPTVARVHDAFLGGKDSYAVDRAVVARLRQITSDSRSGLEASARASRAFARRAVAALAAAGVDQFIDLGCGYPNSPNMHEIAQRHCPGARVIYADNDPGTLVHARALLGGYPGVGVTFAEARDVPELLTHPMVGRLVRLDRPVAVLVVHVLEFLDDPTVARLLDGFAATLPPGSPVLLTQTSPDLLHARAADELAEAASLYSGFVAPYRLRSMAAVTELLHGYTLVPPGVCLADDAWQPVDGKRTGEMTAPVVAAIGCVDRNTSSIDGMQRGVIHPT